MLTMHFDEASKQPGMRTALASILGEEFEVGPTPGGDFAALDIPLSLGIERKAFANLASSMTTGELDEQLAKMAATYDVPVLLIEGLPVPTGDGKVNVWGAGKRFNYSWVVGTIAGWFGRGVMPFFVSSQSATVGTVVALYRTFAKPDHRETYRPRRVLPALRRVTFPEEVMLCFPGVGVERAKAFAHTPLTELAGHDEAYWKGLLGSKTGSRVYNKWREA